jgi:CRP/FNR family cyclic AMP-dependent transcriptional regulator
MVLSRGGNTVASQVWLNFAWPGNTVLGRLDRRVREVVFEAGSQPRTTSAQYLARQDEPGLHAFLLLLGMVKVVVHSTSGFSGLLGVRTAGDIVGELSVLDESVRSASLMTCGPVTVVPIEGRRFRRLMAEQPQFSLVVARMISDRLRWANRRRIDASAYGPLVRIARLLYEIAVCHGTREEEGWDLGITVTQAEIASLAGVGQRTAERDLHELERRKVVTRHYRRLKIIDLDRLKEVADWAGNPPPCVFL